MKYLFIEVDLHRYNKAARYRSFRIMSRKALLKKLKIRSKTLIVPPRKLWRSLMLISRGERKGEEFRRRSKKRRLKLKR